MQILAATSEHDVLRTVANQVGSRTDAVRGSRAGGADRIAQAANLERGGEIGRDRGAHRARHHVWSDLAHATRTQDVGGFHLPVTGTAAAAGDQAGARVADLFIGQAGIGDGVAHRHITVGGGIAHEALELAVDHSIEIEIDGTTDLAAQAAFCRLRQQPDA